MLFVIHLDVLISLTCICMYQKHDEENQINAIKNIPKLKLKYLNGRGSSDECHNQTKSSQKVGLGCP